MKMNEPQMKDQSRTSRLAGEWLAAQLALIDSDVVAARAAIDEIERKAAFARKALDEISGASRDAEQIAPAPTSRSVQHTNLLPTHGLTRNQQTKVRGVAIMEALTAAGGPHALGTIHAKMVAQGFTDEDGTRPVSDSAIRSQLYRLSQIGAIEMVSTGIYRLAPTGLTHLERERIANEHLIKMFSGDGNRAG